VIIIIDPQYYFSPTWFTLIAFNQPQTSVLVQVKKAVSVKWNQQVEDSQWKNWKLSVYRGNK